MLFYQASKNSQSLTLALDIQSDICKFTCSDDLQQPIMILYNLQSSGYEHVTQSHLLINK